jgi:hypothetical protein
MLHLPFSGLESLAILCARRASRDDVKMALWKRGSKIPVQYVVTNLRLPLGVKSKVTTSKPHSSNAFETDFVPQNKSSALLREEGGEAKILDKFDNLDRNEGRTPAQTNPGIQKMSPPSWPQCHVDGHPCNIQNQPATLMKEWLRGQCRLRK